MKYSNIAICVLIASSVSACAPYSSMKHEQRKEKLIEQTINNTDPEVRAFQITEKMIEVLGLTEVQKYKVAVINQDFSARYNLLAASTNPKVDKRKEFISLTKEKDMELKKVLNNAQITKWHEVSAEFWEEYRII